MLVENATKHNSISSETPLLIRISIEGEYVQVLDSDLPRYDGFDRRTHGEHHFTVGGRLSLYLPSRTVLVLRKL